MKLSKDDKDTVIKVSFVILLVIVFGPLLSVLFHTFMWLVFSWPFSLTVGQVFGTVAYTFGALLIGVPVADLLINLGVDNADQ